MIGKWEETRRVSSSHIDPPARGASPGVVLTVVVALFVCALLLASPGEALVTHRTQDPQVLGSALLGANAGIDFQSVLLQHQEHRNGAISVGRFEHDELLGLGSGIVLSTGDVADYGSGPNESQAQSTVYGRRASVDQQALAEQVIGEGADIFDATQLDFVFETAPGGQEVSFQVAFGSEEWPEYSDARYVDGFGVFLNGELILGSDGFALTANHHGIAELSGTELDGFVIRNGLPVFEIVAALDPEMNGNTLTFLIFDTEDSSLDSTAYVGNLVANPEPGTAILLGLGLCALGGRRRRG